MDQKTVGFPVCLAVLPEVLANGLALFAGIGKHEAFFPARMFKDIAHARIRRLGSGIRSGFHGKRLYGDRLTLVSLRLRVEKMFHRKPPHLFAAVAFGNNRLPPAARSKKEPRLLGIADRGGQTDPPWITASRPAQPFDEAEGLPAAVCPQQRMDLVYDDKAQIAEKRRYFAVLSNHQCFQRFGGNLQNPRRLTEQFSLLALRRIPMPARYGDTRFFAELIQPPELIIDKRLERRDVQHTHRGGRLFVQKAQNRKERRFGFTGCRRCRQKHILVGIEDSVARRILNSPERLPAGAVNIILYKGCVSIKNIHCGSLLSSVKHLHAMAPRNVRGRRSVKQAFPQLFFQTGYFDDKALGKNRLIFRYATIHR